MGAVLRKISNLFHPKVGEIWCLHRVCPKRSAYKSNRELEVTPDFLEQLITERRNQGFRFVDMDTMVAVANGKRRGRKLIHISFDDGFADVFANAYPILKQYQVPFTLYVTTDMPDGKADLWWLQLEQLAQGDIQWFEQTIKQIYSRRCDIAATMHSMTSSTADFDLCKQMSLTWEQIRVMASEGLCTVGSHGVSHSAMKYLSTEQSCFELSASKHRLEEMLGVEVCHFSYPHSFVGESTNRLVWQSGYRTAVVGFGGAIRRKKGNSFFNRTLIVQP